MDIIQSPQEHKELSRIQNRMEKDLVRCGALPTSVAYAMNALDPFHDINQTVAGFPDSVGGKSVVQSIQRQQEVVVPTPLASGKWDCHITVNPSQTGANASGAGNSDDHLWPVALCQGSTATGTSDDNLLLPLYTVGSTSPTYANYDVATNVIPGGLIQICSAPAGTQTFTPLADLHYDSISVDDILQNNDSTSRIIGMAFEVHNTTESLHKSGAVTVYRTDCQADEPGTIAAVSVARFAAYDVSASSLSTRPNNATGVAIGSCSNILHRRRRLPPTSIAQATQLHSATWEAGEGCLVPVTMDLSEDLVPRRPASCAALHIHSDVVPAANGIGTRLPTGPADTLSNVPANASGPAKVGYISNVVTLGTSSSGASELIETASAPTAVLETNLNRSGAYFHGLSPETTLTLLVRVFIEQFPNPGSAFMPLATLSAPYDPHIIECMSKIYGELAPGYPAHMNGMGDFFREVAGFIKNIADEASPYLGPALTALSTMPLPVAQTIGKAGLTGLALAKQLPSRSKANKIKVQTPQAGKKR